MIINPTPTTKQVKAAPRDPNSSNFFLPINNMIIKYTYSS
jgi:hypothetical protein